MSGFWAVFKRELKGYFATPVAYVFLVIFLFFAGYLPFRDGFFEMRQADLRLFFNALPLLFVFMVPSTAMRLWAEERKSSSIELLTLRLPSARRYWASFCGVVFSGYRACCDISAAYRVIYLGDRTSADYNRLSGLFCWPAVSGDWDFFSALTKNQVISFILSVAACGILSLRPHYP